MEPDIQGIDVAHLFSTLNPHYTYLRLKYLKAKGVPVVVSTIFWEWEPDELERELRIRLGAAGRYLSRALEAVRDASPMKIRHLLERSPLPYQLQRRFYELESRIGLRPMRKYVFDHADVLLPNSHIEYEFLQDRYAIHNDYIAVPNAVDSEISKGSANTFHLKFGLRDFVLCVAVVQIRKNQLRLIRAVNGLDCPLVLIGPEEARYAERCRKEASDSVFFLGELRGDDLRNAYAAATTHALVSFYETPGLSSLEGAISDNTIVVSDRGSTREYFKEQAFYCDPNSVDSIKSALRDALNSEPDGELKNRLLTEYTWDKAAEKTMAGYTLAAAKAGHRPS